MECAQSTIKEAVQAIQELDFGQDACGINRYIQGKNAKQGHSFIMNSERPGILLDVCSLLNIFSGCDKTFFHAIKTFIKGQKRKNVKHIMLHLFLKSVDVAAD